MSAVRRAIVRQFSRPSGPFGRLVGWIMANRPSNRQRNEWAIALLAPKAGERLLEIGSYALAHCARHVEGVSLTGLDHSPLMVDAARKRLAREASAADARLEEGGLERLAEWPEHFDGVWSVNVVQLVQDLPAAFGAIRDALKPGGRVVASISRVPGRSPARRPCARPSRSPTPCEPPASSKSARRCWS